MSAPHDYKRAYEIRRLEIIRRCVDRMSSNGSLIEFGCNAGSMTAEFARVFGSVLAIDCDADLVQQATARVGEDRVHFLRHDLNDTLPECFSGAFDAAIALEVIEHLSDPPAFVKQIRRCLRIGGRLLISSPNMSSPEAAMGRFLGTRDGREYDAWDPSHVSLLDVGSLLRMLALGGFRIDRLTGYYYGFVVPKIRANVRWRASTALWPFNRLGFNSIVEARAIGPG